jgi:ribonuclease M5
MAKIKIKEALVVEGRYDKNTLSQIVDAPIFVTNGFGIFKDPETLALLRAVAEQRGLIVLTDADGGGLVIRNHLKGAIDPALVKHAYIPDVPGKERRKAAPGKEGKLGVEGMTPEVLLAALRNAGATFLDEESLSNEDVGTSIARPREFQGRLCSGMLDGRTSDACPYNRDTDPITKTDLYELGLSGRPDSKEKRRALQKRLSLPENLSSNALLTALNCLMTRDEFYAL